jgi:hypothetical protein
MLLQAAPQPRQRQVLLYHRVDGACAGASGATLAIVELMPSDTLETFGITEDAANLDVHMLAMLDGMERTKVQLVAVA